MKVTKILVSLMLMSIVLAPAVVAQEECAIFDTIQRVTTLVMTIGGALAVLALTFVGIMMFNASDPAEKDRLKERLKYIIMGLVIIVVAPMIVNYILGQGACGTP